MLFSSSQRQTSAEPPKLPSDLGPPLMDLSSLEGPPMVGSTFFVSSDIPSPRIHTYTRSPTRVLRPKSLTSIPASTNILSPQEHRNRRPIWPSSHSIANGHLGQKPGHTNRTDPRGPSPDCGPRYVRELSSSTQSQDRRQSQRCLPLTWLEDEKKWVVGEIYPSNTHDSQPQHDPYPSRPPISPASPISPYRDMIQRLDEHIAYNNRLEREGLLDQSPLYGGHGFTSAHRAALNDRVARWVAMTQGMHQDQEWV
ncbi:hypothetical protein N7457_009308 [Penicillium paradoxum]|uniref:uncharacterized protein n=1 Tax=Penicillium paradoxum TaxID=176176 RepID=UPI0025470D8C|nr:uncharacterized protein N7457_009308 [Penicillium paradoxum]KAJ5774412.1 hypothetical protein N7457_009308 [Penicillium paradoxum]